MPNIIDVLSEQVQDELPKTVHDSFRGLDSVYEYIENTSMDVKQADSANMGYKWQINHLFAGGSVAGRIQSANPEGMDVYTNTDYANDGIKIPDTSSSDATPFPSYSNMPHAGVIERTLQLHMNTGNFSFPVQWLQHDKLSATHVKQLAMDIKALGENRARAEAISFFNKKATDSSGNSYPVMGQVAEVADSSTPTSNNLVITIKSGRINYFRRGMFLNIYSNDSGNIEPTESGLRNDDGSQILLMVTKVDYLNNQIHVAGFDTSGTRKDLSSGGDLSDDVAVDDWISWYHGAKSLVANRPLVTWGLEDWIADSGKIFGGAFSIDEQPHFASKIYSNSDSPLDETTLTKTVGSFIDSYGLSAPDSIITTWGVTLKFLQGPASNSFTERVNYERNGKAQDVAAGFDDVGYKFNGRDMRWLISSLCLPNTLYSMNLRDGNIKRYVPPKLDKKGDDRVGNEIEFLNKAVNGGNIFKVAHSSSGGSMNMVEAPFWQYRLVAPIDVKACKITDITEI